MTEAVRFYWRGREESIPLGEIPEADRKPLRIRRSVVQLYTPTVFQQLADGRFVAAVWEADGRIKLILCHPNLAKGGTDAFVLDTTLLPHVVLRVPRWDEVPGATALFLRAFGSEASSVEDCAAARRDLVDWLDRHGQAEMALIVRRYSNFPFGVRSDALEVIEAWRRLVIRGEREQIDCFFADVDQRFSRLGWSRETNIEADRNRGRPETSRFFCWVSNALPSPRVLLCLKRTAERRVRGGEYNIEAGAGIASLATAMQLALKEVIEPAAAALGLNVMYPRLGPISRIGPKTEATMAALAESADGEWPLPPSALPLWRHLIISAYQENVAIKPEELTAWFTASGWDEAPASELTRHFYGEMALIAEYEEAGRQPA